MPIYDSPYASTKGSSSPGGYTNTGYGSFGGDSGTFDEAPPPSDSKPDLRGPGTISFDLTDPVGSINEGVDVTNDILGGALAGLFGTKNPDPTGSHGGLIGDIPLVGALTRGAGEVVSGAVGLAGDVLTNVVGNTADRIPTSPGNVERTQAAYDALPADSEAKIAAEEAMKDPDKQGLFGTDILSLKPHLQAVAVQEYERENLPNNPQLMAGVFRPDATWGDALNNLFGVFEGGVRVGQRLISGADKADGMNRLKAIMAVGDGQGTFVTGGILGSGIGPDITPAGKASRGLTQQEQTVYDNYESGAWSETQALDYLTAVGAGYSHDTSMNIAASIALDPINVATLGAGAVAKLGRVGAKLISTANDAQALLDATRIERAAALAAGNADEVAKADKLLESTQRLLDGALAGIKSSADPVSARNILGQLAKTRASGTAARAFGGVYGSLAEGESLAHVGRLAKGVRTMIDPIHQWGANPKVQASISEGSRQVSHAFVRAHGEGNTIAVLHRLDSIGGESLTSAMENGWAVHAANRLRAVVGKSYRASQMGTVGDLIETAPYEHLKNLVKGYTKSSMTRLEEDAVAHIKRVWNDDDRLNLAKRMSTLYPGKSTEEWLAEFADKKFWNAERMSLLHSSNYGQAVTDLHSAIRQVVTNAETGKHFERLHQIILVNKTTLTDIGAQGILKRIADKAGDLDAQMAEMRAAKAEYPALRNFAEDPTSQTRSLDEFIKLVNDKMPSLPSQLDYAERGALPPSLRAFAERMGGAAPDGSEDIYTLAFRPKDEFLWGVEADNHGVLSIVGDPWFDQVSLGVETYSPVRSLAYNASGGVIGSAVSAGAKALDGVEAAGRTILHGVTGSLIHTAAKERFTQNVYAQFGGATDEVSQGLTKQQVNKIWEALTDYVGTSRDYSSVRGLNKDTMWKAAKGAIPDWAERAGFDRRQLMLAVVDAYNGDLRHIGLTQKFTGSVKAATARLTNANTLGEISEHLWPMLKFRYNPIFQVQEKVEPWILNAQRGAAVAIGSKITEGDQITAGIFRNLVENNLVSTADNDIAELGNLFAWGKGMDTLAQSNNSQLNRFGRALEALREVQYGKQLNQMRTFQKGLGRELKMVWEDTHPGVWDDMLKHEQAVAGRILSDDEFAVRMAAQNGAANDIIVKRMLDGNGNLQSIQTNFINAINVGRWAEPGHIGDLQTLDLETMARSLGLRAGGEDIATLNDLRRHLSRGTISMDQVDRALRDVSAHADYRQRVASALAFNWDTFWASAKTGYSLSDEEVGRFQTLFRSMATRQGMTPEEYMSQIYQPVVLNGGTFHPGSLGALVETTRNGRLESAPSLAALTGAEGSSSVEDLYKQMSSVMATHLHPSAKLSFLMGMIDPGNTELTAFQDAVRAGSIDLDNLTIEAMFDSHGQDALSQSLLGFVQGTPGTGAHVLAPEAGGVESIRNGARMYHADRGQPLPSTQRVVYDEDPTFGAEIAQAYQTLALSRHVATQGELDLPVLLSSIRGTAPSLKPEARELSAALRAQYTATVRDTRNLYQHLTENMHIDVQPQTGGFRYASADDLRADLARGVLRVADSGYWHPVILKEDMFMRRAVEDAFGYGQEAVEFGSQHALVSAAAMYSDEGRGTYMADLIGARSWERYGQDIVPAIEAEPVTLSGYQARYGTAASRVTQEPHGLTNIAATRSVGPELQAADIAVQNEVFGVLGPIRNEFPDVRLDSVNLGRLGGNAAAATLPWKDEAPTIVLGVDSGWQNDAAARAAARGRRQGVHDLNFAITGVRDTFSAHPVDDLYHEFGHAVDIYLHQMAYRQTGVWSDTYVSQRLTDLMESLKNNKAVNKQISAYASERNTNDLLPESERFGELFALAFNPDHAAYVAGRAAHDGETISPELKRYVEAFRQELKDSGVWVPGGRPFYGNSPFAGQTIADANAAGAGIRAESRVGSLPQDVMDRITATFIGQGRYSQSDPNVARMGGFLHDYMQDHLGAMMEHGSAAEGAYFMDGLPGAPIVPDPVPYDFTQARLRDAMVQSLASKWQDSFRLQYFAQNRSMLQRSINHPMFGLYPASYMWGKIGPELFKFMAYEPFGVKSGAALYTVADMQKAVAIQRTYDTEFDKRISELGKSAAMGFLSYMLPATLWEVPASYPVWMRELAKQGNANTTRVEAGKEVKNFNGVPLATGVIGKLNPLETQINWMSRGLAQFGDFLGAGEQPEANTLFDASGKLIPPPPSPAAAVPTEAPAAADLSQPVTGGMLGVTLVDEMRNLQALFGG